MVTAAQDAMDKYTDDSRYQHTVGTKRGMLMTKVCLYRWAFVSNLVWTDQRVYAYHEKC